MVISNETEPSSRRKLTRSKKGCLTCRRRRKLCDMETPFCGACNRLHLECQWPERSQVRSGRDSKSPSNSSRSISTPHASTRWDPPANTINSLSPVIPFMGNTGLMSLIGWNSPSSLSGPPIDTIPLDLSASTMDSPIMMDGFEGLSELFNLDESILQQLAVECLQLPPSQSLQRSTCLETTVPTHSLAEITVPMSTASNIPAPERSPSPHETLLNYFQNTLSQLVSCSDDASPNAFHAFTNLAKAVPEDGAGSVLHLSILAWAGRHMANGGQVKYEAVSEQLGAQATRLLVEQFKSQGDITRASEAERLSLLASALMVMQFKICRGDVWGFADIVTEVSRVSKSLFDGTSPSVSGSMSDQFFENLVYHDILSSLAYTQSCIVDPAVIAGHNSTAPENVLTLTGVNFRLFCLMYEVAALVRHRRSQRQSFTDDYLVDNVQAVTNLEGRLKEEKIRIDDFVRERPMVKSHRYLHEAFRTATLINIQSSVLQAVPTSLNMRLLVRQSLSLLEIMSEQKLPGLCSAHWVLFVTAMNSLPQDAGSAVSDDRKRSLKLYDDLMDQFHFSNVPRSLKVVQEIWARSQSGSVFVDWLDVVTEWNWELFVA